MYRLLLYGNTHNEANIGLLPTPATPQLERYHGILSRLKHPDLSYLKKIAVQHFIV